MKREVILPHKASFSPNTNTAYTSLKIQSLCIDTQIEHTETCLLQAAVYWTASIAAAG